MFFLKLSLVFALLALLFSIALPENLIENKYKLKKAESKFNNYKDYMILSIIWGLFNAGSLSFITFSFIHSIEIKLLSQLMTFFIGSSTMIGGLFLGSLIGFLLDKYKKLIKIFIVYGCLSMGIAIILFYFTNLNHFSILFFIIGGSLVPTSVFSYNTLYEHQSSDNVFSMLAISMGIGSLIGPSLAGAIMNLNTGIYSFLLMSLFLISGSILGFYLKKDRE
jgi:MFS family permease